jgi:hypothetical protein
MELQLMVQMEPQMECALINLAHNVQNKLVVHPTGSIPIPPNVPIPFSLSVPLSYRSLHGLNLQLYSPTR